MKTLNEFMNEQLENTEFKKEYEKIQPEMDVIRAIVDARIAQNLTQKELSERTGIDLLIRISLCINPCLPISHGNLLPTAGCRFSYRDGNVRAE